MKNTLLIVVASTMLGLLVTGCQPQAEGNTDAPANTPASTTTGVKSAEGMSSTPVAPTDANAPAANAPAPDKK